ncbi:hypothetical protein TL16_g03425 [Triparma laevis f. inornata]|uniref:Uncharacterized protein n=1 Tax=Triparma laevis f. inornata TaxID=1714386 RepID=A0A9W6ZXF1_9STRA|nr:hypothetical protein TL16_g03425 [Triparma laevis f. inornata]
MNTILARVNSTILNAFYTNSSLRSSDVRPRLLASLVAAVGRVENMLFPSSDAEKKKSSTDAETQSIVASAVKTTAVWYKASETVVNDLLNEIAIKAIDKDGAVNDAR